MRFLTALVLLSLGATTLMAQSVPAPVKLKIRCADPYFVKALLEGMQVSFPEMSTIWGVTGGAPKGGQGGGGGTPLFEGGHLVVNPTDNSIWFFPDRKS